MQVKEKQEFTGKKTDQMIIFRNVKVNKMAELATYQTQAYCDWIIMEIEQCEGWEE